MSEPSNKQIASANWIGIDNAGRASQETDYCIQYEVHLHIDCAWPRLDCDCSERLFTVDLFAVDAQRAAYVASTVAYACDGDYVSVSIDSFRHVETLDNGVDVYYDTSDDGYDGFAISVMALD